MQQIEALITEMNQALADTNFFFENVEKNSQNEEIYKNEIKEAHTYPLIAGGKRIRPLLTLLTAGAIAGEKGVETARKSALAVEMIHTYTLVHDDLPCMDNDDLRRGRPTTHKVYGEAKALLVGDGLIAQAFLTLLETNWKDGCDFTKSLFEVLAKAAGPSGVIWGQWLDISLIGKEDTSWDLMEIVHTYKTGLLLSASLELGFICGLSQLKKQPSDKFIINCRGKIKKAGILIGLAFQIIDDILDATNTTQELGKTAGKDASQGKFTAIRILGKQKAEDLSAQYTEIAMNHLQEIFEEIGTAESSTVINSYQSLLIQQIKSLLQRLN